LGRGKKRGGKKEKRKTAGPTFLPGEEASAGGESLVTYLFPRAFRGGKKMKKNPAARNGLRLCPDGGGEKKKKKEKGGTNPKKSDAYQEARL